MHLRIDLDVLDVRRFVDNMQRSAHVRSPENTAKTVDGGDEIQQSQEPSNKNSRCQNIVEYRAFAHDREEGVLPFVEAQVSRVQISGHCMHVVVCIHRHHSRFKYMLVTAVISFQFGHR